jgi:dipeptidase
MKRYVRIGMVGSFIAVAMTLTAIVSTASAQFTQVVQGGAQCSEEGPGCGCNPEQMDCGCTSIMVGKQASTDGSVMTAHSCDGNYRTWLQIEPRRSNPTGADRPIYWGKLHTETPDDLRGMRLKGSIPEVTETYRYFNVAYPAMNEKGLAIGETTIGGKRELRNDEGLFLIENLQALTLERTTTARDAIRLIGELVKEYGYGDWGECLTFADAKEVWHLEIMGAGPMDVGAVWAAVRIPDNHVGVSANIPRISSINLDDPDHYMASDNVFSLAEEMGYWDPNSGEEFKWWKAYGSVDSDGNARPPYSTREFYILSTLAPSLNLTMDLEELPFSVVPDDKVSVQKVLAYYRETYEGTEFDMTKNLMVAPRSRYGQSTEGEKVTSPAIEDRSHHSGCTVFILAGDPSKRLAAARDRDGCLFLVRQSRPESTHTYLGRRDGVTRELPGRLPEELPHRFGMLVVPSCQSTGNDQMGLGPRVLGGRGHGIREPDVR